ncbi:MAG: topoisomerase DNA-binding C4 zinc finger domain-containing protein [Candidatus Yanofskybacteria bacterium]|nr:topoisomerase DNA-binding C4 zinc finger domain-containing protein [Candidatus Yanofskybacteria bacterium]
MIIKRGRFGKFTACSNFPTCKNVLKEEKKEPEKTGEKCPECGEGELVIRKGRFGDFIACSRFPKCKYTRKIPKEGEAAESTEPKKEETEEIKEDSNEPSDESSEPESSEPIA